MSILIEKMYDELARSSIDAALSNDWKVAIRLNKKILKSTPDDVNTLNRLAQAYLRTGSFKKADKVVIEVIGIDPLNNIALKCKDRIAIAKEINIDFSETEPVVNPNLFIEEPGKTKLVNLINLCELSFLAALRPGQVVQMVTRKPKVVITTQGEVYIGRLPDDVANRMIYLNEVGNDYEAYLRSATGEGVKIFIREINTNGSAPDLISFPVRK